MFLNGRNYSRDSDCFAMDCCQALGSHRQACVHSGMASPGATLGIGSLALQEMAEPYGRSWTLVGSCYS